MIRKQILSISHLFSTKKRLIASLILIVLITILITTASISLYKNRERTPDRSPRYTETPSKENDDSYDVLTVRNFPISGSLKVDGRLFVEILFEGAHH